MDIFGTYPSNSVARTAEQLREAAARAVVLADADAAAFVDRSCWRSPASIRPLAAGLAKQIAKAEGLRDGTGMSANGRDKQRRKASNMKQQPRLHAKVA
jgi:hypothetical protein